MGGSVWVQIPWCDFVYGKHDFTEMAQWLVHANFNFMFNLSNVLLYVLHNVLYYALQTIEFFRIEFYRIYRICGALF